MYPTTSDSFLSAEFLESQGLPQNTGDLFYPVVCRTYLRWREDAKRRETWLEAVQRVVEYVSSLYQGPASKTELNSYAERMFDKIYNLKLLPAGRTLWVGGTEAVRRCGEAVFNCSYVSIDSLEVFSEIFYLLLCGCGVGFSVEPQYIDNLPLFTGSNKTLTHVDYEATPEAMREEHTFSQEVGEHTVYLAIGDSKEAWAKALKVFLEVYTDPRPLTIRVNYNSIRPEGSRIKTFGGHAPGPEGLRKMYDNLHTLFSGMNDQRLTSVQAMDICNHVAKNVVIGGNRRSSEIALGASDDLAFVTAKSLENFSQNPQRIMSNNSLVFRQKPSKERLLEVFENIKYNGEPGFVNIEAMQLRRPDVRGVNPCVTKDTWVLTSEGPRQVQDLVGIPFNAIVEGQEYESSGFFKTGHRKVFKLTTVKGQEVKLTEEHKVLTSKGWKQAKNLLEEDLISLNTEGLDVWTGRGSFKEGWLLGNMVGDGCPSYLRYWEDTQTDEAEKALSMVSSCASHRSDLKVVKHKVNNYSQVACVGLRKLAEEFGIDSFNKVHISSEIEKSSRNFYRGFLRGLFDAGGSPQGNIVKGVSVCLLQSNKSFLVGIQRMLLRLGIVSTIRHAKDAEFYTLPGSSRNPAFSYCKDSYELIISEASVLKFQQFIGFSNPKHKLRLEKILKSYTRNLYQDSKYVRFLSLEDAGIDDVYDCKVERVHRFDANGVIVHNCGEILLDSRGFCNLSTVVLPSHMKDGRLDLEDLIDSVALATRIGVSMTNVTVSLPKWDLVQKRDRLTGVSMTGFMDALDELGIDFDSPDAINILSSMRQAANEEATNLAYEMRIPRPLLVTATKPEGTLSQLPTVSSGLHKAYAPYFLRRIRFAKFDPVAEALTRLGMEAIVDPQKPERLIFEFPIKSKTKVNSEDEPALDQLRRYYTFMRYYVDHNASCTLTFDAETEIPELIDEVYKNWEDTVAVAWLPKYISKSGESPYPYMPYEAITEKEYIRRKAVLPDFNQLPDMINLVEVAQTEVELIESECAGGACPIR